MGKVISELLKDIQDAMLESLQDSDGEGEWSIGEKCVHVTTSFSRDPRRSRNGGEYYYYRVFDLVPGGVQVSDDWSCEIAPRSAYGGEGGFYPIALSTLERIGLLAESRALAIWNEQAVPVCPTCGQGLEDIFAQIETDDQLHDVVVEFLKQKVGFKELREAVQ